VLQFRFGLDELIHRFLPAESLFGESRVVRKSRVADASVITSPKTKRALGGKSKAEIVAATASALDKRELPALEPGAM
jgi:hypothetical protein